MELKAEMIQLDQSFSSKEEAIRASGDLLIQDGAVEDKYVDYMLEREKVVSTHMGNFVAIPHGTADAKENVNHTAISFVQVPAGVDFGDGAGEEKQAMAIFGIAGVGDEHLDLLQKIAIVCSDVKNVVRLAEADTAEEVIEILKEEDE